MSSIKTRSSVSESARWQVLLMESSGLNDLGTNTSEVPGTNSKPASPCNNSKRDKGIQKRRLQHLPNSSSRLLSTVLVTVTVYDGIVTPPT